MKALMIAVVTLVSFRCYAIDGNELLRLCSPVEQGSYTIDETMGLQFCYGYIFAVLDTDSLWHGLMSNDGNHKHEKSKVCLPSDGIPNTQSARIVVKYLKEHPETLNLNAAPLVLNAMMKAFRCR